MRWEELTGNQFSKAVEQTEGVCLLPLSVIERHGHHLPLGTDMYIGRELCNRAAELEPAVVFPDFIFTQILEARHLPGTIGIQPDLIIKLLENICQEIARNGLKKIVIVNAHGGNNSLIQYFAQIQLASPRDYVVYVADFHTGESSESDPWETAVDGHAGEIETSAILAIRPELVHTDALPTDGEGVPLGRLKVLRDLGTGLGIWWYGDHPTHYRGDGIPATPKKGEYLFTTQSDKLAKVIRAIKDDQEAHRLQEEFFGQINSP